MPENFKKQIKKEEGEEIINKETKEDIAKEENKIIEEIFKEKGVSKDVWDIFNEVAEEERHYKKPNNRYGNLNQQDKDWDNSQRKD